MTRRYAGASWWTSSRAQDRTATAAVVAEALELRSAPMRPRVDERFARRGGPGGRGACPCRSHCSNISPRTDWRCPRRCLPRRRLEPAQWRALLRVADEETRQFVETLHPEMPPPRAGPHRGTDRACRPNRLSGSRRQRQSPAGPSLSDVVARIERRRRNRADSRRARSAGAVPAEAPALFRWECGPSGEIAWVEGAPRGPLIGRSIARVQDEDGDRVDEEVVRAFAHARAVPRCRADACRRGTRRWRMEDQRRSRVRADRRTLRRLSRHRAARIGAARRARTESVPATCSPIRIRFASWSTRSRLRSTRSSASPRSSRANISVPPISDIASARPRSSPRRACC